MDLAYAEIAIETLVTVTGGAGPKALLASPKPLGFRNGPETLPNGQAAPYKSARWWQWARERGFPY